MATQINITKAIVAIIFVIFSCENIYTQQSSLTRGYIDTIMLRLNAPKKRIVNFGVSMGYRTIFKDQQNKYFSPAITNRDSTLTFDKLDPNSFLLSTSVIITPFQKWQFLADRIDYSYNSKKYFCFALWKFLANLGFSANINILEFSNASQGLVFNKNLEGGVGISLKLADNIYVTYNNDAILTRSLRNYLKEGDPIYNKNKKIGSINDIDKNDDNFFVTKVLIGRVIRIVITL